MQARWSRRSLVSVFLSAALAGSALAQTPRSHWSPARIDSLFSDFDHPDGPGASVMVIRNGRVLYRKGYGLANLEERQRVDTRTNFRLASLTKEFTAMSVLILADRGRLRLDDSIGSYLEGLPPRVRPISIRQMLNHTSGLLDYEELMAPDLAIPLKDRDVLGLLRGPDSTRFAPGTAWEYSNSGYVLLGLIVQRVSGKSFARFLHDNIFQPLGMTRSVAFENGISTVDARAYGYSPADSGWILTDQSMTSGTLGDGGIYTSVEDLYRWDQALYGNRLVRPALKAQAFRSGRLVDGGETGYGFGWYVGSYRDLPGMWHTGSTIGFRNAIRRIPGRRLTVIVLTNRDNALPLDLADRIVDMVEFGE